MLDFLLVLGQIPGTPFFITFNEIVLAFLIWAARYEYRLHRRFVHWVWYRICVRYRRYKRMARTYIKVKRYRLAVWEHRQIRHGKSIIRRRKLAAIMTVIRTKRLIRNSIRRTYKRTINAIDRRIRRTKRAIRMAAKRLYRATIVASLLAYRRTKRNISLKIRRTKRAIAFQTVTLPKRKLRSAKMRSRRFRRNVNENIYRRYRRVYRAIAKRNRRMERAFKESRLGGVYAGISYSLRPSSRD